MLVNSVPLSETIVFGMASFSDYLVQLTRNPLTGQRCVRNKN